MGIENVCLNATLVCNEKCIYCFRGEGALFLNAEKAKVLVRTFRNLEIKKINLTGGEPTLVPEIGLIINIFKKEGFIVSMTTNGTRFLPNLVEQLDWVSFSIDSLDKGILKKLGRSPILLDNVQKYLHYIRNKNLGVRVKINSVFTAINSTEENLISLADFINSNSDIVKRWKLFKFLPIRRAKSKSYLEITEEKFNRLIFLAKKISNVKVSSGTKPHYIINYRGNYFELFQATEKGDKFLCKINLKGECYSDHTISSTIDFQPVG